MSIYIVPALIALFLKVIILIAAYRSVQHSGSLFRLLIVFALHNVCEILIFLKFDGANIGYVLTAYYMTSIWALTFMLFYASDVSRLNNQPLKIGLLAVATVLSAVLLTSGLVIDGARSIGYVLTAVRGPFYWIFQAYSAAIYVLLALALIYGYRRAKEHIVEIQCTSTLLALAPLVLLSFAVMIMMNLGFSVNATAILPLGTTAFLGIIVLSESKHRLTDVRRFLPWSPERRTSNEIMDIFSDYARDDVNYRDAVSAIEKLLVVHKYQKNDQNASATAELMGMPRSSLYSIFNRLKIESKTQSS